jgi:hypothetical protein
MLNKDAIAERRIKPTKSFEKLKELELKKYNASKHIPDSVYGLGYGDLVSPTFFYVGITNDTARRWRDHLRNVKNPVDMKDAYIEWRDIGIDKVFMVVLDPTAEFTEAEWVSILTEQGHTLTNVAAAVDSKRKKKLTASASVENMQSRRKVSEGMHEWLTEVYGKDYQA